MFEQQHKGFVDRFGNVTTPTELVGKLHTGQIAQRSTWSGVGNEEVATMAMHTIRCIPVGSTTVTMVNPLDPGTADGSGWVETPMHYPADVRHRRMT